MSRTFDIKTKVSLVDKISEPLDKVNARIRGAFKPFRQLYNASAKLYKELGIPKVGKAWNNVSKSIGKVGSEIKSLGTEIAVMAGAASAAITAIVWKTSNLGDAAAKNAQKIGISTKAWTELEYAGDMSGVNTDAMRGSLTKLNKTIFEAAAGNKQAQYWFKAAGVSIHDQNGKLRSADDILGDVANKFADPNFTNGPKRAALAMGLFGKSGVELVPLLNSGKEGLDEMRREAEELGITFTDLEGKQSEAFGDSISRVKKAITGVILTIGKQLLPTLTEWADYLKDLIVAHRELVGTKVKEWLEVFKNYLPVLQDRLRKIWKDVSQFAAKIDRLVDSFGGWGEVLPKIAVALAAIKLLPLISATAGLLKNIILLGSAFSGVLIRSMTLVGVGLKSLVLFLVANPLVAAVAIIAGAAYLIYRNWDKIGPWFTKLWTAIKTTFWAAIDGIISFLSKFGSALYSVGASILGGLWNGLKAGASAISGWFKTAWNWWGAVFTSVGRTLYGAGVAVLSALWNGVMAVYKTGVAWFKGAWRCLTDVFVPIGIMLYSVGAGVIRRLWDGLKDVSSAIQGWFVGAWEWLKDTIAGIGTQLYAVGAAALRSLWDGMKAAYAAVSGWFSGLFTTLAEALLPDLSASATRVTAAFDTSFLGGLIALVQEFSPVIWFARAFEAVIQHITGIKLSDAGAAIIDSLWDGLKSGWAKVTEWFNEAIDSLVGYLPDWAKKKLGFKVDIQTPEIPELEISQPELPQIPDPTSRIQEMQSVPRPKSNLAKLGDFISGFWDPKPQPTEPEGQIIEQNLVGQTPPQSQALTMVQEKAKREQQTMTGHVAVDFNNAPAGMTARFSENTSGKIQRSPNPFGETILRGPNHLGIS